MDMYSTMYRKEVCQQKLERLIHLYEQIEETWPESEEQEVYVPIKEGA
ncbi:MULTISPECIES: hypothetical protein [Gracilibacillus]|nr:MULTISPECIES: hypothetical protein [Gracilibacillus]